MTSRSLRAPKRVMQKAWWYTVGQSVGQVRAVLVVRWGRARPSGASDFLTAAGRAARLADCLPLPKAQKKANEKDHGGPARRRGGVG